MRTAQNDKCFFFAFCRREIPGVRVASCRAVRQHLRGVLPSAWGGDPQRGKKSSLECERDHQKCSVGYKACTYSWRDSGHRGNGRWAGEERPRGGARPCTATSGAGLVCFNETETENVICPT